jgi:uncharacterized oligopeptide transporter (OPT) family protein
LLGANPKKQFFAQLFGVFFGTVAIVPAWYLMIPTKEVLEFYNLPSTNMWRAVAESDDLLQFLRLLPRRARGADLGAHP